MQSKLKNRAKCASKPALLKEISQGETAAINAAASPTFSENNFLQSKKSKKTIPTPDSMDSILTPSAVGPKFAIKGIDPYTYPAGLPAPMANVKGRKLPS